MRAVLGNVEEMARNYPGFEAPPAEYREGLRPGDLAELMFLSDQVPKGRWAEVTEIPGEGWYRGVLDTGEWIDFGPEHVADVKSPSPTMGVSPFKDFGSGRVPERKPSIWDWEDRALWIEAQRKKEEAARAAKGLPPKRSFWEWIWRKKTAPPVTPIPEAERRSPPRPRGLLPGPVEIFEEQPPPPPPPLRQAPPPAPEAPTIIVPPVSAVPNAIIVPEAPVERQEAPISYFDILGPETPSAPPKEERGLIILPSEPPTPPPATGLVPAGTPDVFSVLAPAEPPSPGGLIIPEGPRAPIVSRPDVFEILAPAVPAPMELSPFEVLPAPGEMVVAPPSAPATPFDVLVPAPGEMTVAMPGEVTPYDVLAPAGGMTVAMPATPFDVLVPEGPGGGLAPYAPPQELSPFEVVAPPPTGGPGWGGWAAPAVAPEAEEEEEEAPKKKKKKKFKQLEMSLKSTIADWVEWIEHNFDLEDLWDGIRNERDSEWHKHYLAHEEGTGLPATIGILTEQNGDWPSLMHDLGIPYEQVSKYVQAMEKEAEDEGYFGSAWEDFRVKALDPLSSKIEKAFNRVKPKDITGQFLLDEDGKTEGQYYGIIYYEPMSDAEREKILREEEETAERQYKEQQEGKRKADQEKKDRLSQLRRIWGKMPEPEDLEAWVDEMYSPEFWKSVVKKVKSKGFQDEKVEADENGEYAVMELEAIAEDGDNLFDQLWSYFGLPPDILGVYFDQSKPEDEPEDELWDEVLHPYFRVASEAMNRAKPKSLPGWFEFGWDDDEWQFWLKYLEE